MKSRGLVFCFVIIFLGIVIILSCAIIDRVVVYSEAGGRGDGARAK
jgi:hypothetical protein